MKCYLCENKNLDIITVEDIDAYEKLIGINVGKRYWFKCPQCELYQQENFLTDADLERIYRKYRDPAIRDSSIKVLFKKIKEMPNSENQQRINQLLVDGVLKEGKALDIGSGFGIFPYSLLPYFKNVACIEPNQESASFINSDLGIQCFNTFYQYVAFYEEYDFISCLHLLEHIRDPIEFLNDIKQNLNSNGVLFIEVPDACEFNYLSSDHDEFNSCHLYMYDVSTLDRIVRKAGFTPYLIRRLKYKERNLSRIYLLAHVTKNDHD